MRFKRRMNFAMRAFRYLPALCVLGVLSAPLGAVVVGTSQPAESLSEARVKALPLLQRRDWQEYLKRSAAQEKADRAALAAERQGMTEIPPLPKQGFSGRAIPLHREAAFYKSDEARRIGDAILSFQIPSGGWSKNLAMTEPRAKGQSYAAANAPPTPAPDGDFDKPRDENWHYVGTLDNDATNTELHFLAELSEAMPGHDGDKYRASFLRGVQYLLNAQYPNGGWPQVWPLEGGYHDAITFNDNAVTESAEMLSNVAKRGHIAQQAFGEDGSPASADAPVEDYSFVPEALAKRAARATDKAISCILATQIRIPTPNTSGTLLTVWGQQHDPLTLLPVSGRNYEPAAFSSGESADIMIYLMSLPNPSSAVMDSIDAAAAWFSIHRINGFAFTGGRSTPGGRKLTAQQNAGPLWARYYSIQSGRPIFGDRDKSIHDDVSELSLERRNGYAWYVAGPKAALDRYAAWKQEHAG